MLNKMDMQTNIEFNFFGKKIEDRFFNRGEVIMKKSLVSSSTYSTSKMTTKKQGLSFIPFLGSDPHFLASVFYKAGFIENWGKGTLNIINECLEYGLPKPTYEYEWTAVRTTFYKAKIDVGLNEVFEFIKQHQPTKATIIAQSFNVTQRTIERYIKQLKDSEKIEFRGSSKTGGYYVW